MKFEDLNFSDTDEIYCKWYVCNNCQEDEIRKGDNYCCNCGTKIEYGEEE